MVGLKRSNLLVRDRVAGVCAGASKYFLDGPPTHAQMLFNLANGPVLDPIQVMQIVDLISGEHGPLPFMGQKAPL
jgi:hypothetical protein